jgi:hypothetical protein
VTDLLEELFKDRDVKSEYRHDQVLNELRDIKSLLTELLSEVKKGESGRQDALCNELLNKAYVIARGDVAKTRPMLVSIPLSDTRYLVLHKDTLGLLKMHFELSRDEEKLMGALPNHLKSIFIFMKREGIVYYDANTKKFELI